MDVISLTRELGKTIQQDERYKRFMNASELSDTDTELQNKIGEFNLKRSELSEAMRNPTDDPDRVTGLDKELNELYDEIIRDPKMVAYNEAKADMDALIKSISYIIQMAANGEDPETCPATPPQSCTGSCGTCGGCG
ncbi:MAG: YlbF family regulator [Ruminococcus sp.]|nr:YlbF family regulator [Ruminococcus sp.]